jgi:signal transduction histidine kinase
MICERLKDLPEISALGYFGLILFFPSNIWPKEREFLQDLRKIHPGSKLPIVVLDPKQQLENDDDLHLLKVQDYRSGTITKKELHFSLDLLLEVHFEIDKLQQNVEHLQKEQQEQNQLLKEVGMKAQESDRLKTAFLNNISHELRTPMNGILGFLEYLEDPHLEGEIRSQFIQNIQVSSDRLLNTLQDLIEISEIETGDLKLKFKSVDLPAILEFTRVIYEPRALQKDLSFAISMDLPESKLKLWTDPNKLKGILIHLLNNALKFTANGEVSLHVSLVKEKICFKVRDTGIGMNEKDLKNIYQSFVQVEEHLTRNFDGLGLGLSICEVYSRCLNGELNIESEEGIGTLASLEIPFIQGQSQQKKGGQEPGALIHFNKAKILLVDDDPINLMVLEKMLGDHCTELTAIKARNGVEAVQYFREQRDFDLILMDLKMPLLNGFEATKQIRAMDQEIPIIAQTAYAMNQDRERALNHGCNDYLSKPLNKDLFLQTVAKFLIR